MNFIERRPTLQRNVEVLNDMADLYRYFRLHRQCGDPFFGCVERTVDRDFAARDRRPARDRTKPCAASWTRSRCPTASRRISSCSSVRTTERCPAGDARVNLRSSGTTKSERSKPSCAKLLKDTRSGKSIQMATERRSLRRATMPARKALAMDDREPCSICIRCAKHESLKRYVKQNGQNFYLYHWLEFNDYGRSLADDDMHISRVGGRQS
jgi:hypothetical protein